MCPACFAAAAWVAAGAGSAGGLTAFVLTRRRSRRLLKAEQARAGLVAADAEPAQGARFRDGHMPTCGTS